jgi:hypothetical protein
MNERPWWQAVKGWRPKWEINRERERDRERAREVKHTCVRARMGERKVRDKYSDDRESV